MSFTWKELQHFLLCRRQQKVWFHLAGKAKLNPGNKKTKVIQLKSIYQLTSKRKAQIPETPQADIIWLKNESNRDFYRLTFTSSPLCQTNGLKAFSTLYNLHPFRILSVWINFSQFGQWHPQTLYFFFIFSSSTTPFLKTPHHCLQTEVMSVSMSIKTIWQHYGRHQRVWHVERHDTLYLRDKLSMWL